MQDFFVTIGFLNPLIEWLFSGWSPDTYQLTLFLGTFAAFFLYTYGFVVPHRFNKPFWFTRGRTIAFFYAMIGVFGVFISTFDGVTLKGNGKYVETSEAIALFADGEEEREFPVVIVRYRFIGTDQWEPWHVLK